ncbi:MAG: 50S ribosomal protein L11 methyltransferase [Mogibacterium sp.]|nr:50S ribosomal protein L11 methyltransferase [Mogibacterium sp.]
MKYKELIIKVKRKESEMVQAALLEHGFASMQIDDPMDAVDIAEHRELYKYDYINEEISRKAAEAEAGDGAITITLYFTDDEVGQNLLGEAEKLLSGIDGVSFVTEKTGDDSEWLYKWQEYFKPSKVGERIVVKPGWEDYEAAEGELVIEMDPGMAFGSGLHETTSMCIKALEKDLGDGSERSYDPSRYPIKVLDVGTGTGIFAMAAVLLGADEALGIDIDDEAVRVANENIVKNGLEGRISIRRGNLMDGIDYEPDIIVANLMADLVVMLSSAAAAQLSPGGVYITSGILDIKEDVVKKAIEDAGFDIIEVLADGEWRAIYAVRR